ncbi:uncharacterized protein LOC142486119 isoform X2 [Ascaphus truei]|uniref:uncharacterized protein LOC142486119 isoform X2 n=1 Tax=Ascaphus truei TaxID=8439 RepID=UPI003F598581
MANTMFLIICIVVGKEIRGSLSQQTAFLYGTENGSVQFPDLYAAQSVFQFVRLSHGQIFCEHIMGGKVQCMTIFEGRVDSLNGSFLLKNLIKQDEGTYQSMKVIGSIGNAVTATFQLTVLDSRTITQNSSHRGTDISLKANVSGENAILIWTKDGKPLPGKCYLTDNNRTLVLPNAESADAGKYTLTVENSYCKTSVHHDLLVTGKRMSNTNPVESEQNVQEMQCLNGNGVTDHTTLDVNQTNGTCQRTL